MKKKIIILICILLIAIGSGVCAQEHGNVKESNSIESITEKLYEQYGIYELDEYYIESGLDKTLGYSSIKEFLMSLARGKFNWDKESLFKGFRNLMFGEISSALNLFAQIIFISIMAAILNNISTSFGNKQVNQIAFYAIYFILIGLIAKSLYTTLALANQTIDTVVTFVKAILPMLLLLLASVGAVATSSVLSTLVIYIVGFIGTVVNDVVYPLIIASAIICLIDHLSDDIKLSNLAKLLKEIAMVILGVLSIVFLGIVSIQGVMMNTFDGISAKTAKYAIDNFIPFVGGFLADSLDTILSASNIIKNGIGAIGLLIIVALIAFPIIKMFVLVLMFKLSSAIIQPISDNRIVKCLSDMGSYIVLIMACLLVIATMLFLLISIIVMLGDMTVMYR